MPIRGRVALMPFDPISVQCGSALPVRLIESSCDLGWSSVLVEHHQVLDAEDVFETLPTRDHTIVVMTRGEQHLQSYRSGSWRSTIYRPGTVGMTPSGAVSRLRRSVNADAGAAHKVNIYIPPEFFIEAAEHFGGAPADPIEALRSPGHLDEAVRQVALTLIRAMRAGAPDAYAESVARWLAMHLSTFARGLEGQDSLSSDGTIADPRLRKAAAFITEHYGEPLSMADIAAAAGISRYHFSRLFRSATGTSPYRHLLETRLDAARRMLETSSLPIADVAARCGFERASYFATQFFRRFGINPRDARLETRHSD